MSKLSDFLSSESFPDMENRAGSTLIVNQTESSVEWGPKQTISEDEPSGGRDGDIWYQVEE